MHSLFLRFFLVYTKVALGLRIFICQIRFARAHRSKRFREVGPVFQYFICLTESKRAYHRNKTKNTQSSIEGGFGAAAPAFNLFDLPRIFRTLTHITTQNDEEKNASIEGEPIADGVDPIARIAKNDFSVRFSCQLVRSYSWSRKAISGNMKIDRRLVSRRRRRRW